MTGWVIGGAIVTAVLVLICLFISSNALARRVRVIFTVGAVFGIVLLAAVPSLYYNITPSGHENASEGSSISLQMQLGGSTSETAAASGANNSIEEDIDMDKQVASAQIQRALGMIEGISLVADRSTADALAAAVELIEEALGVNSATAPVQESADTGAAASGFVWHDASRYYPAEDGWYMAEVDGYEDSIPVKFRFDTQTFETTDGDEVKVKRWANWAE